mmetsp:Transcript_6091/g.12772  ORF Transcript_6091/g.12772 Transcript_6091/m.12772 type:complete len:264 (+) Transcript_6091:739-1530(+)
MIPMLTITFAMSYNRRTLVFIPFSSLGELAALPSIFSDASERERTLFPTRNICINFCDNLPRLLSLLESLFGNGTGLAPLNAFIDRPFDLTSSGHIKKACCWSSARTKQRRTLPCHMYVFLHFLLTISMLSKIFMISYILLLSTSRAFAAASIEIPSESSTISISPYRLMNFSQSRPNDLSFRLYVLELSDFFDLDDGPVSGVVEFPTSENDLFPPREISDSTPPIIAAAASRSLIESPPLLVRLGLLEKWGDDSRVHTSSSD